MKASIFGSLMYLSPGEEAEGWPIAPAAYDGDLGAHNLHNGIEQLELADSLGFDWISTSEHHYSNASLAPHPALLAAALTNRIHNARLAVLGHILPLNNPVRVAEELAMLDNLSDGRLVVGMLRGTPNEYQAYSVNPAETRDRSLESMELILKAWEEPQPFGWEGRYYQYRTVSVWPRPLQKPRPPVYVLGTSRESAAFAAAHGLGLGISFDHFDLFTDLVQFYRDQCALAGWQPTPDHLLYRGRAYVAETDAQAEEDARLYWSIPVNNQIRMAQSVTSAIASLDPSPRNPAAGYGSQERRALVTFIGGPDTVFNEIKRCRDTLGVGIIDFWFQGRQMNHDRTMKAIELFGKKVLPRIHEL